MPSKSASVKCEHGRKVGHMCGKYFFEQCLAFAREFGDPASAIQRRVAAGAVDKTAKTSAFADVAPAIH